MQRATEENSGDVEDGDLKLVLGCLAESKSK